MKQTQMNYKKTSPKTTSSYHEKQRPSFQEEPKEKKNVREHSKNIMEMNQRTWHLRTNEMGKTNTKQIKRSIW